MNEQCKTAITQFYQLKTLRKPTFEDYISLKTFGNDEYSKLHYNELYNCCRDKIKPYYYNFKYLSITDKEYVMRWILRGLTTVDAFKRLKADMVCRAKAVDNIVNSLER